MRETKLILGLILIAVGLWIIGSSTQHLQTPQTPYDECVAAGNPVLKIYPGICVWPDGREVKQIIPGVNDVKTFDECVAAGYPVMESYPEQCKTADGKLFVHKISTDGCQSDAECENGYYCMYGLCTEFSLETSCDTDTDCMLIDTTLRFSCCYEGACDYKEYSHDKWKAVNTQWFTSERTDNCTDTSACGPAPQCYGGADPNYRASCVSGICQKVVTPHCVATCTPESSYELTGCDHQHTICTQLTTEDTCIQSTSAECRWVAH